MFLLRKRREPSEAKVTEYRVNKFLSGIGRKNLKVSLRSTVVGCHKTNI